MTATSPLTNIARLTLRERALGPAFPSTERSRDASERERLRDTLDAPASTNRPADATRKSLAPPTVMLVGVDGLLAEAIRAELSPIPVICVGHLAAASERILLTRPLVVVVACSGVSPELDHFRELTRACGTALIPLGELGPQAVVARRVERLLMAMVQLRSVGP